MNVQDLYCGQLREISELLVWCMLRSTGLWLFVPQCSQHIHVCRAVRDTRTVSNRYFSVSSGR